ncbi:MAG: PAS domain-containing protein [Bacteroidia bacterium]|nr:PAS domain-containing protein [Bacteroidia bacterium]
MPLKSREKFFEEVLENLQGDIAILDHKMRYVYVNPYAVNSEEMRAWLIGKTDREYCEHTGSDRSIALKREEMFQQAIARKEIVEWEEKLINKAGETNFFLRRVCPILNEKTKRVSFLIGHGLNITQQRMYREELETNRRLTDTVLNASPNLIFVKDAEGRFILVNKAVTEIFNLSAAQMINRSNDDLHGNKAEVKIYSDIDNRVIRTRKPVRLEESFTMADGTVIWYDTVKVPLVGVDGQVNVLGISTDITERKKKEDLLLESRQQLDEAQRLTKSGNWVRHMENDRVEWSPGMFHVWERDPEEGVPTLEYIMSTIPIADHAEIYRQVGEVVELNVKREFTYRVHLPSGEKHLKTFARAVCDESGKVSAVFGSVIDITEQVLTERRLLKNEQRLSEAQAMARVGSYEYNLSTGEIEWSKGMYWIWELDFSEKPSLDLFHRYLHPDDVAYVGEHERIERPLDSSWTIRYRIITPSGKVKHLEVFSKLIPAQDGVSLLVVGSCIDITERKENEEKLLLNEQRLFEAQELSNSGSWEVDVLNNGKITWTPGMYKIWDCDPSEPEPDSETFYRYIAEEDRERVKTIFSGLLRGRESVELFFRVKTKKNADKVFYSKGKAILDAQGNVLKVYGTTTDVTEQQLTEERLRKSEQSLLQAQQIAKLGSWHLDLKTYRMEWTAGVFYIWERDLNLPVPSFEEMRRTIHPEDLERLEEALLLTSTTAQEQLVEFRIVLPGGKIKHLEGRGRLTDSSSPKSGKLFGTVMDITERKKVEEELIKAREIAEESSKAKEYFLANISHELRTPLNGILGMSRLLKKSSLNASQRDYTDVLHQTAENLLVIINDILDFAKIEAGKLSLEEIDFDPARVADTAVQLQMFKAEEKDLTLRHMHKGNLSMPMVSGDPYRLNQILLNLLNNAIKYTNHGEVTLTHEVMEETSDYVKILFTVRDTGIGIPKDLQSRIFESFTQVEAAAGRQTGVGLGLTISRSLVERQGGKIWVESEPDQGSQFHFHITYRKARQLSEKSESTSVDMKHLGSLNILLAEDNKVNLFITEAMLHDWGFKVDVAGNGEEALDLFSKNDYDLVLMDIQMPVMDGLEATRQIRKLKDPRKAGVPVIALTANTGRQAHKQFMVGGMNDWVVKPFKEETLYKKIAMHIRGKDWLSDTMRKRKFPLRKKPLGSSPETLYDLSMLRRDAIHNKDFLKRMLGIFVESIPPIVEKMQQHFLLSEFDEISNLAHKIKPTIDGAGIYVLKDTIRNIEGYREKRRNTNQLQSDLDILQEVIDKVTTAFREEIKSLETQ